MPLTEYDGKDLAAVAKSYGFSEQEINDLTKEDPFLRDSIFEASTFTNFNIGHLSKIDHPRQEVVTEMYNERKRKTEVEEIAIGMKMLQMNNLHTIPDNETNALTLSEALDEKDYNVLKVGFVKSIQLYQILFHFINIQFSNGIFHCNNSFQFM